MQANSTRGGTFVGHTAFKRCECLDTGGCHYISIAAQMKLTWLLSRLFVIAVSGNYVWEIAQAPLYVGMDSFKVVWWHCGVAALGDGLLVLLIYVIGGTVLNKQDWFVHPRTIGYVIMMFVGLAIGVGIEWLAVVVTNRWEYTVRMPLVPLLGVGLIPVAQMLVLPPLVFRLVAIWSDRASAVRSS